MQTLPDDGFRYAVDLPGYCVSRDGRVFSCRKGRWQEVVQWTPPRGRRVRRVWLFVGKRGKAAKTVARVDRLVYRAFNGPIPPGKVVAPLDGNPANNSADNLVAVSPKEGRILRAKRGTERPNAVLTEADVVLIRRAVHAAGDRVDWKQITKDYGRGTGEFNIRSIAKGETWRHVDAGVPYHVFGPKTPPPRRDKLTPDDVRQIRQRIANREPPKLVYRSYAHLIQWATFMCVVNGKTWKSVRI